MHVILNMDDHDNRFELPLLDGRRWHRAIDTARSAPEDASDPGTEPVVADDAFYLVGGRSAVVLVSAAANR